MMELYHYGMSTCSQKVRLVFAEKGVEFVSHEVNLATGDQHNPDYAKLNPAHVVPTLVHNGVVYFESSLIIRYLDALVAANPMQPTDAAGQYQVSWWLNLIDKKVHPQAPNLTFAMGPREMIRQQPPEAIARQVDAIPDRQEREARRSIITHGIEAPEFIEALEVFLQMLDTMETQLADRPWLSGNAYGLADATVAPYVLRVGDIGMGPLLDPSLRPRVVNWFTRVCALPSYQKAVVDWTIPAITKLLRERGETYWPQVARMVETLA